MLARGIRTYHRPVRLEDALAQVASGARPLAGGTRLLATPAELPAVVDLGGLGLRSIEFHDSDLVLGAGTTLQDVLDSPEAWRATAGLLPLACRLQSPSWMIRNMATLGGEAVHGASDSEVLATLAVLNAVFVVHRPGGRDEIPALRFLRSPQGDLGRDGLLTSLFLSAEPDAAVLERVAVAPSAPPLVAVAVALSLTPDHKTCARVRIALTGLTTPPARVPEAESRLEGAPAEQKAIEQAIEQVENRAPFRDDAHAPAWYRRKVGGALLRRALVRAFAQARAGQETAAPASVRSRAAAALPALSGFQKGPVTLVVNGRPFTAEVEARTTLLEMLRQQGLRGVKHGCETGECGACAVLLDGRPVNTCLTLAASAHGRRLETVEGLGTPENLHPVQQAFVDTGAIQCGYCTPAMELVAKALLDTVPRPSEQQVREALAGCLCRCTGYVKPVEAVLRAAGAE